ncbi:MAG: Trk system potassium transporter TrkA [Anaerotignum sp.]
MKIVIIGDGKVGSKIAKQLSIEGHDVTVIDNNPKAFQHTGNTMEIFTIEGNGATISVLEQAGIQNTDILIAATSADEVNMICCLLGKKLGAKNTIARVRNPEYFAQMGMIKDELGLSMAVNPERAAATEISRLLRFPSAIKIEPFALGRVEMVEIRINENSPLDGMPLYAIYKEFQVKVLICAVQREDEVFIPSGDFILKAGDKINVTASHVQIANFFRAIGIFRSGVKSVMIVGGGRIAYYLAKELGRVNVKVKIIEKNLERCQYLCEMLPEAIIIHGDGTDKELIHEEGLDKTDAFVTLTGMDEENIIVGLYAKEKKVSKVVAKINKISFHEILDNLNIDSFISPKSIAAHNIVSYVRSMKNSMGSNNVETMHTMINDQVEAVEFKVMEESPIVGIPLKNFKRRDGILVAAIIRDTQIIIPNGHDMIQKGDNVVVVTTKKHLSDLNEIQE